MWVVTCGAWVYGEITKVCKVKKPKLVEDYLKMQRRFIISLQGWRSGRDQKNSD